MWQNIFRRRFQLRSVGAPLVLRFSRHFFEYLPREELVIKEKTKVRDRPYLAGSSAGGFPEFLAEPTDSFPHAIQAQTPQERSLNNWAVRCREYIDTNLIDQGAILFRNLPMRTAGHFAAFCKELGYHGMGYEGGAGFRHVVNKDAFVYTASDNPKEFNIGMHNEMSYMFGSPKKVRKYSADKLAKQFI